MFVENIAIELKRRGVLATAEESSTQYEGRVGFPDVTVREGNRLAGWIELKLPNDHLDKAAFQKQFVKYRDALENIVFTNLREWQLWQWNSEGKPEKIITLHFDLLDVITGEEKKLLDFFQKYFEGHAYSANTPKQLALALARKARFLSQQIEEASKDVSEGSELSRLKKFFEDTLIETIAPHQFANMIAETMTYSLFLAALEHEERDTGSVLSLDTAIGYLPKNVPILKGMYNLVKNVSESEKSILHAVEGVLEQLKNSEIGSIRAKLQDPKRGRDPVAEYFYEDFLAAYDPEAKKHGGVYYTPKPVVDFIVAATDSLLRAKFGKNEGLADKSVSILDPATGTGTFLMSAIQTIYAAIERENGALGESIVKGKFSEVVCRHILKHFYGFELMMAPYAMAHLKLSLLIEKYGFSWEEAYKDSDKENDRFQIYLANTLDDPRQPPRIDIPGFKIAEESNKATTVKNETPVLAIIGNPPYSNFGMMNKQQWILDLLESYKKGLNETKINLDDDYIKFIRFAQWKIEESGGGIFAMITANSFLDGVTHRQMRASILKDFDEVYIVNLHGNSRKGEICPDGSKDENVFNIQTGVSINIFVRLPERKQKCTVKYLDLWGRREAKFEWCNDQSDQSLTDTDWFEKIAWREIDWQQFNTDFLSTRWSAKLGALNFLLPSAADAGAKMLEYGNFWGATEIFEHYNSGIQTKCDELSMHFDEFDLLKVVGDFESLSEQELKTKYQLKDSSGWNVGNAKKDLMQNIGEVVKVDYRPFDRRATFYTGKTAGFMGRPRIRTMRHMLQPNLGLIYTRFDRQMSLGYFGVCKSLLDLHFLDSAGDSMIISPLYLYPETNTEQDELFAETSRVPNISQKFIDDLKAKIGLEFKADGRGDLKKDFGPEDVFYYAYAVFHSPAYRARYAEQLKIDFPRLPLTSDIEIFRKLVELGNQLVNLHLLGENPFDASPTIFDDTKQWGVSAGGIAPSGTDDWQVTKVEYDPASKRVSVNAGQYFEGIEKEVWEFMVGGYQVLDKWLKDRKKAGRCLSADDLKHYLKIIVSLRETRVKMEAIDDSVKNWPIA